MVQAAAQTKMSTWSSVVPGINTDPCCYMDTDPSMALSVSTSHNFTVASGGRADTHIWQFLSTLKCPVPLLFTMLQPVCFSSSPICPPHICTLQWLSMWVGHMADRPLGDFLCGTVADRLLCVYSLTMPSGSRQVSWSPYLTMKHGMTAGRSLDIVFLLHCVVWRQVCLCVSVCLKILDFFVVVFNFFFSV